VREDQALEAAFASRRIKMRNKNTDGQAAPEDICRTREQ
jgi:hypothetical protein